MAAMQSTYRDAKIITTDDNPQRKGGTFVIETIKHGFAQMTSNRCNVQITYKCVSFILYVCAGFSENISKEISIREAHF